MLNFSIAGYRRVLDKIYMTWSGVGSLCFDVSVIQCSMNKSRAWACFCDDIDQALRDECSTIP